MSDRNVLTLWIQNPVFHISLIQLSLVDFMSDFYGFKVFCAAVIMELFSRQTFDTVATTEEEDNAEEEEEEEDQVRDDVLLDLVWNLIHYFESNDGLCKKNLFWTILNPVQNCSKLKNRFCQFLDFPRSLFSP